MDEYRSRYAPRRPGRRNYFWLLAVDEGKPILVFGGDTEQAAREKGFTTLSGVEWEIRELPTRDTARASALIRGKRLDDTHNLHSARQRMMHERGLQRRRRF